MIEEVKKQAPCGCRFESGRIMFCGAHAVLLFRGERQLDLSYRMLRHSERGVYFVLGMLAGLLASSFIHH